MRQLFQLGCILAALVAAGCSATTLGSKSHPPPPPSITVVVSPATANIRAGDSFVFRATVTGATNQSVTWSVSGAAGGTAALGTVSTSGNYTAPATLPNPNAATVRATSAADSSASGASTVTFLNPTPVLTGVSPASVGTGNFSLTVTGSKFVSGAQVLFGTTLLATTYVSATQLTATGSASSAGTYPISVTNPSPGSSSSSTVNLQVTGSTQPSSCSSMALGQGASLGAFVPFPADNLWNTDISSAPVDPSSAPIINFIGSGIGIHPDFGAGQYNGSTIGIPYLIVGAQQSPVTINFTAYGSESDPGPMPIPVAAPIEGYPNPGTGDRHVLVLDNSNCFLYELYSSYANGSTWNAAPMGMRLRLKASFDVSGYSALNQVILNALKKYGMIMADNGSNMYISGAPDDRWNNSDLHNLGQVTTSDFEVIQMTPLYTQSNVPSGAAPQITSFTASSNSISAGTEVTLSWQVTGASYVIVSPDAGAVRGTSVVVVPTQSTTYTLYATNPFGRTTSTASITVH
jgi:hypothetical protein